MRTVRLVVLGLVLLIGLLPAGGGQASGYGTAARMTEDSLKQTTPSVTRTEEAVSLPEGASGGWWTSVQEDIGRSEYQVTWQDHTYLPDLRTAYQAPNRAHNLRTYFTPDGIRLIPRTGYGVAWEWGSELTGYGYQGAIQPVAPATLSAEGNRVEYRRGGLTEWYVNDERGLEQAFTLDAPPPGAHGRGPLQIHLALTGDLTPALTENGRAIELKTEADVRVLRYGGLYAEDATGRRLPASITISGAGVSLALDEGDGLYPITVRLLATRDGLSTTAAWTAESDQAGANFGVSVGTAGDVNGDGYSDVIVGARFYDNGKTDEGRAFVYHGGSTGLTTGSADWTAESDQAEARFGVSVSTAGDVNGDGYSDVIVGAYRVRHNGWRATRAGPSCTTVVRLRGSATGSADWTAEERPGRSLVRRLGGYGGRRERRWLRRRHRRGAWQYDQRGERRGPGLRVSR